MTKENKGAAVALPETHYNAYGDGSEPLYTAEMMHDYAAAVRAEGEADLRAQLAAVEAEVVQLRAQRDEAVAVLRFIKRGIESGHIKGGAFLDFNDPDAAQIAIKHPGAVISDFLASLKEQA